MKMSKKFFAILATTIILSITASSLLLVNAQANYVQNPADQLNLLQGNGTTSYNAQYSSASNSAYADAQAKWGDVMNPAYYCGYPAFGQGGARTCFADGPAPDRPDVAWTTGDQLMGYTGLNYSYPVISSWGGAPLAMDGKLISSASIRLPNNTVISALTALNPTTGSIIWYTPWPVIPQRNFNLPHTGANTSNTLSLSSDFVGPNIYRVDDTHFTIGGTSMWRTDGTFLWYDRFMAYGDDYNTLYVAEAPWYESVGASGTAPGTRASLIRCYDLSNPEVNMNIYNDSDPMQQLATGRSKWNYTCSESENPGMCFDMDNNLVIRGSYCTCAVYALNGTDGHKVWETILPTDSGYSGCYANGRVYVGCLSCAETCLNSTTGAIIWRNTDGYANRGFNVWQVGYAYGRVYYHDLGSGRTGATKCYDALTGQKLWASTSLFSIAYYVFKIADGKVYGSEADASTTTGRTPDPAAFYCWDAFTGEVIWKLRQQVTCPVVAYGSLYIVNSGCLICISTAFPPQGWTEWRGNTQFPGITMDDAPRDFSNGPVWTYQTGASIMGSCVVDNGKVFVGSGDQYIYALDAYNGSVIWKFKTNQPLNVEWGSTCAVYGGVVITGGDDGFVYGLDENTGKQLWKVDVGPYINVRDGLGQHNIRSSPVIYQGIAYIGSFNNKTYAIDPLTGATKWTSDLGATIIGSAAFDYNGSMYIETMTNRIFKLSLGTDPTGPAAGTILLNFTVNVTPIGQAFSFGESSHTPSISLDKKEIYIGGIGNLFEAYWTSNGSLVTRSNGPSIPGVGNNWFNIQPHVLAENSHGAMCVVPANMLSPTNQTLSAPTLPNGTIWSGIPLTYVNSTAANPQVGGPQVAAYSFYKGQYTFAPTTMWGASGTNAYATNQSYIVGQAGPTVVCTSTNYYNVSATVPGITGSTNVTISQPGDNIWSDWGGWEVWSSPIFASFGTNSLVFYGSESYAIHCINASNGVPLTWWTTNGPMGSSPAIYDGKLYCASAEGKVYCFEEHQTTQTTTTASVDNTSPNAGQAVNVTVKLNSVPSINVYEEIGQAAPIPSIPSQAIIVTFIKPDGTTTVNVPATTDMYGNAVVTYTPDVGGNWQVVAAYNGIMGPRETYAKSASDVIALTVGGSSATATPTTSSTPSATASPTAVVTVTPTIAPTSSTGNTTDNTLLYAGIAVVVIVIIVLAALVLMRRKK